MGRQKTKDWDNKKRIKEGKIISGMRDDDISWDIILSSYHITYNTAMKLVREYRASITGDSNDCDS